MKETICTIPINDIFMPKCGCPFCRMESMLEEQYVKFITGDAMMEPNIRIETNKKGFCHRHFSQMFEKVGSPFTAFRLSKIQCFSQLNPWSFPNLCRGCGNQTLSRNM